MKHNDPLDALIATAKAHDLPPDGAEDRAWAAFVGSVGGGPGGEGADLPLGAKGAAAAGTKLVVGAKALAVIAVVSAGAVGVARWSGSTPTPSVSVAPPAAVEPVESPAAALPPVAAAPRPSPVATPEQVEPAAPRAIMPPPKPPASPPRPDRSPSTLAQEARLVGMMWKALDRGDATKALSLAQSHGARFDGGALDLEARAAALAARCGLGRPIDLHELESVQKAATPSVAKRISAACAKKP